MHIVPLAVVAQVQATPASSTPQTCPQRPQFCWLRKSTQLPSQHPGCAPMLHAFVHVPQCFGSFFVSTHCPPQQVCPDIHVVPQAPHDVPSCMVSTHMPLQHVDPLAQVGAPQAPQLFSSSCRLTHLPAQHELPAAQLVPHAPQFAVSACKLKPSSSLPSQSSSVPLQLSAAAAGVVTHVSSVPRHCSVPFLQMPMLLATVHTTPRFKMLSAMPSQLSSAPSFAQVSVVGITASVHVPNMPLLHDCVPALHLPTFNVLLAAG